MTESQFWLLFKDYDALSFYQWSLITLIFIPSVRWNKNIQLNHEWNALNYNSMGLVIVIYLFRKNNNNINNNDNDAGKSLGRGVFV